METTAKDLVEWARASIDTIAETMGSKNALYIALEEFGISKSWIQKFSSNRPVNPTQVQLDKLIAALTEIAERQSKAA